MNARWGVMCPISFKFYLAFLLAHSGILPGIWHHSDILYGILSNMFEYVQILSNIFHLYFLHPNVSPGWNLDFRWLFWCLAGLPVLFGWDVGWCWWLSCCLISFCMHLLWSALFCFWRGSMFQPVLHQHPKKITKSYPVVCLLKPLSFPTTSSHCRVRNNCSYILYDYIHMKIEREKEVNICL